MFDLVDETANCGNNPFNVWFDNDYVCITGGRHLKPPLHSGVGSISTTRALERTLTL